MSYVSTAMGFVSGMYAQASAAVLASPLAPLYTAYLGDTSFSSFMIDWVPLALSFVLPVLCLVFVVVNICPKPQHKPVGERVVRRITLAIRADVRMIKAMTNTKVVKGKTTPKDVESGKKVSPVKGKQEEAAIKKKAAGKK